MMFWLYCKCECGNTWKHGLPWWSFDISKSLCETCGRQISSVQFMGPREPPALEGDLVTGVLEIAEKLKSN